MFSNSIIAVIAQQSRAELAAMPMLLLQSAALLGIFSISLGVTRHGRQAAFVRKLLPGILFGSAGLVLTMLLGHVGGLYPRSALLFLSGVLGGWRGGLAAYVLIGGARLFSNGAFETTGALFDMMLVTAGGVLMHARIRRRKLRALTWQDMLAAWTCCTALSLAAMPLVLLPGLATEEAVATVTARRIVLSVISLVLIVGVLVLLRRDARDRDAHLARLRQVDIDPLTALPNRRALRGYLDDLLARSHGSVQTLILIEVTNLLDMVLMYGHEWTDGFWSDLVGRLDGESAGAMLRPFGAKPFLFSDLTLALVLHGVSAAQVESSGLVVWLRDELDHSLRDDARGPTPQLSYGVIDVYSGSKADGAAVLRDLSLALRADEQVVRYFHPSMAEKIARIEEIRKLVTRWILTRSPPLHYQAKHVLRTGEIVGAEALLRATDAKGLQIPPGDVLAVIERFHLLVDFEWCTIEAVVRDIARMHRDGQGLPLSVNVSAASLGHAGFGARVVALVMSYAIPPRTLTLEITEVSRVPAGDVVQENWTCLAAAGVRLSLDDFGTGYSALAILARYPFDELKVDYSFVGKLEEPRMRAAVSLAWQTAQRYNAGLVAEGIETRTQLAILEQLGVTCGQGFLFSAAEPFETLVGMCGKASPATDNGGQQTLLGLQRGKHENSFG